MFFVFIFRKCSRRHCWNSEIFCKFSSFRTIFVDERNNQGCSGEGTRVNGVPTPFSCFALKWVWSCFKIASFLGASHTFFISTTSLETTMSYFFCHRIVLYFFDNIHTTPPSWSIELTTVVTIPNALKLMWRCSSIADGPILDAILTSHLSRLNDWPLNLTVFLFGQKRLVWWLHIVNSTLQTVKKTCNSRYKRAKYSEGTRSVAINEVTILPNSNARKRHDFCRDRQKSVVTATNCRYRPWVFKLGCTCLSEGVHLKLAPEGKNMFIYYQGFLKVFLKLKIGSLESEKSGP